MASASLVTLDGAGSDANDLGQTLSYTWSVPAGVTLSDPSAKNPTFTAPTLIAGAASQGLIFGLIVNDGLVDSSSSSVTITVTSAAGVIVPPTVVVGTGDLASVSGTAEPSSSITVTFPDGTSKTVTADSSTGAFTVTSNTAQKSGMILVVSRNAAGTIISSSSSELSGDDISPTVIVGTLILGGNVYSTNITLSEQSTDFDIGDLTLINATAILTGSGNSYTAVLTPIASGAVKLSVASMTFSDPAGNANTASNEVSAVYDNIAPTVVLSSTTTSASAYDTIIVDIVFSEVVTGFSQSDIAASHATLASLTGSGAAYVATFTATGGGSVSFSVAAGVAQDNAGNGNEAAETLHVANVTVAEVQKKIANFQHSRANNLLQNQPELVHLLSGIGGGSFNAAVTRGQSGFKFSSDPNTPIWSTVTGTWSTDDNREIWYIFGAAGSHVQIHPNLIFGGMVQFDHMEESAGIAKVQGTGWMAGLYFVAQIPDQSLYIDGRLLYGETANKISPFGTYTDEFDTKRVLATVGLTGALEYGLTRFIPSLRVSYTRDTQRSYIDSLNNTLPEQMIEMGQIKFGMGFETPVFIAEGNGSSLLTGNISGIGTYTKGTNNAAIVVPSYHGYRARIDLGLTHEMDGGARISITSFYDGIGVTDYESYGANISFEFKF